MAAKPFILTIDFVRRFCYLSVFVKESNERNARYIVKAVYVEAPDKSSGKRKQKIHICYDLVGFIPVDELLKAEQA